MNYDFCLGCGVLIAPQVRQCPVCGFSNAFDEEGELILDEPFINAVNDEFSWTTIIRIDPDKIKG